MSSTIAINFRSDRVRVNGEKRSKSEKNLVFSLF